MWKEEGRRRRGGEGRGGRREGVAKFSQKYSPCKIKPNFQDGRKERKKGKYPRDLSHFPRHIRASSKKTTGPTVENVILSTYTSSLSMRVIV